MSRGKDVCVCKHAFAEHDESGQCEHYCESCDEAGFCLDAKASPEPTEDEVVALLDYIDRDTRSIREQLVAESVIGKVAFQLFGRPLNELRSRQRATEVTRR